jgi:hypothetical protein
MSPKEHQKMIRTIFYSILLIFSPLILAQGSNNKVLIDKVVSSSEELYQALKQANEQNGHQRILLVDGNYYLPKTLQIRSPNITITSLSGKRSNVSLIGNGMKKSIKPDNLIFITTNNITISNITLEQAGNHLIQLSGKHNSDYFRLINCHLKDSYQQLFKVSANTLHSSDYGIIRDSIFEYSAGIGPQWYIGGIDAHGSKNWNVSNNEFHNIASPSKKIAEHAIHFWDNSAHNIIENNIIINSDRGIGFGLKNKKNIGGFIKNNIIIHEDNNHPFADSGIIIENSPNTIIEGNRIWLQHDYPNAIEFRFSKTINVIIKNNKTNKKIVSRNNAQAKLINNMYLYVPISKFDLKGDINHSYFN